MSNWRRQDSGLERRAHRGDLTRTRRAERVTACMVLLALALAALMVALDLAHLI